MSSSPTEVPWATVRARAAGKVLAGGRGGWMVDGRYQPPEKLVDAIVAVLLVHGVIDPASMTRPHQGEQLRRRA